MVEITEHATLTRRPGGGRVSPEHTLEELRALGASLCLDDFGTGYSSLTHIRRYPLAAIKIDRSFVAGVCDHPEDRAVIAAMVGMAGALELEVVGEGVETEEQLAALQHARLRQGTGLPHRPTAAARRRGPAGSRAHGRDWRAAAGLNRPLTQRSRGSDRARRTRGGTPRSRRLPTERHRPPVDEPLQLTGWARSR